LPLVFNYILVYAIRKFQESVEGLELIETHQVLASADDNLLGKSMNIKMNTFY